MVDLLPYFLYICVTDQFQFNPLVMDITFNTELKRSIFTINNDCQLKNEYNIEYLIFFFLCSNIFDLKLSIDHNCSKPLQMRPALYHNIKFILYL